MKALAASEGPSPVLAFRDLTLGYDRHPAVHHLDCAIGRGELVALVGPNGAGKSTLLKGIIGEAKPLDGRIDRGQLRPREIAYLPQAAEIDRSFPITVFDLAAAGLWRRLGAWKGLGRRDVGQVESALAAVGLTGFEDRTLATLSGGQMQRVLFARVLLQDAAVILLDEPFTSIDTKTTSDLLDLVRAGMARSARSSRRCTTSTRFAATSRAPSSSRANRSRSGRPRRS
jgi:zinc/manganese transport system ATP-binding protein